MDAPREGTDLGRTSWGWVVGVVGVPYLRSLDVFKQKCAVSVCRWTGIPCRAFGMGARVLSVEPVYFSSVEWAQDLCLTEGLGKQSVSW